MGLMYITTKQYISQTEYRLFNLLKPTGYVMHHQV